MNAQLFTEPENSESFHRPLTPEEADKLPHIHRLLLKRYGQPSPRDPWDPLTQLIYSLLSSRTRTPASHQVMRDLERAFSAAPGNWEPVRDASVGDIERAIAILTFPEAKAPHLKATLEGITSRVGSLTLDFLAKYRTDKIRSWLETVPRCRPAGERRRGELFDAAPPGAQYRRSPSACHPAPLCGSTGQCHHYGRTSHAPGS